MHALLTLYDRLDATTSRDDKLAALRDFFRQAPPDEAAWGLWLFVGNRLKRVITAGELRDAAAAASGLPGWLIDHCRDATGDGAETIALILPDPPVPSIPSLAEIISGYITPMRRATVTQRAALLTQLWSRLPARHRFLFHKLISGTFRVGVSRGLAVRALAEIATIDPAVMEHRVMGDWQPTAAFLADLLSSSSTGATSSPAAGLAKPYPFCLAHQLDAPPDQVLGSASDWQAEWKWDGIRAQLIRRRADDHDVTLLWSRGEELLSDRFPEVLAAASSLPAGTVLDGEILAWEGERPLPFADLQTRITKKQQESLLFHDVPVIFLAYDILEHDGADIRAKPTSERRKLLESIFADLHKDPAAPLQQSPILPATSWPDLAAFRATSRSRGVEGLMLKHLASPYGVGRHKDLTSDSATPRGWWKWKIDPYTVDAVLIYAQRGSGRRAGVFTDYTFAVWDGQVSGSGKLVAVAKAYSGLTDEEINEVDAFIRANTLPLAGPAIVRAVEPKLVFEIAFEGIAPSTRHKSGVALRFPRIARWRRDKQDVEADTLTSLRALMNAPR